jgi:hypothetical protein
MVYLSLYMVYFTFMTTSLFYWIIINTKEKGVKLRLEAKPGYSFAANLSCRYQPA